MKTAVLWDERCTYHEMGYLHPETPRRMVAINEVLHGDGVGKELLFLPPRFGLKEQIAWIHDPNYIKRIESTDGIDVTHLDPDTSTNRYTWEAAKRAVGATIACTEAVLNGECKNSYAFVRPPGHHAEKDHAKGFCFFNNVAIAAEWLIREKNLERVAIIDFDVHHGNGTQHAFYDRSDVFFVSTHRSPFYPGTGEADEIGEGKGRGYNYNIPMQAGCDDDDYMRAFDKITERIVDYKPQFILVSAGYDTHVDDPLGGMKMTTEGFREMMKMLLTMASETCEGKLSMTLEGGYDLKALRNSVEVQLEAMSEAKVVRKVPKK